MKPSSHTRRFMRGTLCTLCVALSGSALAQSTCPERPDLSERFEAAVQEYRAHRFEGAYGRFVQLADLGHPEAIRIAWMMYRNGKTLHGSAWYLSPSQIERWSAAVVEDARRAAIDTQEPWLADGRRRPLEWSAARAGSNDFSRPGRCFTRSGTTPTSPRGKDRIMESHLKDIDAPALLGTRRSPNPQELLAALNAYLTAGLAANAPATARFTAMSTCGPTCPRNGSANCTST